MDIAFYYCCNFYYCFIASSFIRSWSGFSSESWKMDSVKDVMPAVRESDVVVIVTDHKAYDYKAILDSSQFIFDTRNAMSKIAKDSPKVVKL